MEVRAKELMRRYSSSMGQQNLDEPVIEYLAKCSTLIFRRLGVQNCTVVCSLLLEFAQGGEECETLVDVMSNYFTKPVSSDDLHRLKQSLEQTPEPEKPSHCLGKCEMAEDKTKSKLNANAVEFTPGAVQHEEPYTEELVQMDLVEFIDGRLQDPDHDPIELLSNLFPDMEVAELERLYKENEESFVWTWEALLMERGGFETVASKRKGENSSPGAAPGHQRGLPKQLDLGEEAFPGLPGQKPVTAVNHCNNTKKMYLDMAKKKQPQKTIDRTNAATPQQESCPASWKEKNENEESIPWVVTGEAVSKQYKELRAAAVEYAKMRNACFSEATKAFFSGNKALARELGTEGRMYCEEMKRCHHEASEAIFSHRNAQLRRMMSSSSPEAVDLHGLHVAEARRILARELKERAKQKPRGRRKVIHLIVGTGHHTKGARTPSRLPPAVQSFLTEEGYAYRLTKPGVIEVDI